MQMSTPDAWTERVCIDCGEPYAVGLNGTWLCLEHFEERLSAQMRALREGWEGVFGQ